MLYVSYPGNFSVLVERQFPQGWGSSDRSFRTVGSDAEEKSALGTVPANIPALDSATGQPIETGGARAVTQLSAPQDKQELLRVARGSRDVAKFLPNLSDISVPLRARCLKVTHGSAGRKRKRSFFNGFNIWSPMSDTNVNKPIRQAVDASSLCPACMG
ncbi:hypothetical protein EYF80_001040 [Liparis tanakae]|uniref:Uncharacterized protein n=1 Tax=Liparis tanakae TaxID=230148 RepID=A0A4Z2JGD4_9TELE|nr:hypothetical protein EYF80_001040 [Liparis tanakae]